MRKIIREGVKTRVLMLSATPVNNRLADLRNQIAFVTEGDDTALFEHGIASIDSTTRASRRQFNRWLDCPTRPKNALAAGRNAGLRLLHPAGPPDHRPLAQATSRSTTAPPRPAASPSRCRPSTSRPTSTGRRVPLDPRHQP
jgi:hypothetical protein